MELISSRLSIPLDKQRGARDPYTTMDAVKVELLESRTDLIPTDMRIVGFKDEDEFTRESYVKCIFLKMPMDARRPKANVIDGTHCTPEFLACLTMDRFRLHLPVYREALLG